MITNRQEIIDKLIDEHDCKYSEEFVDWLLGNANSCNGCKYEEDGDSHYCECCVRSFYAADNYEKDTQQ